MMKKTLTGILLATSIAGSALAGTVSTNYTGRLEITNNVNGTNSVPAVVDFTSNPNATYGWDSGLDKAWKNVPLNGQSGAYVKQGVFDAEDAYVPNNSLAPVTVGLTYKGSTTNASHTVTVNLPLFTPSYTFDVLEGSSVITNGVISADTILNLPTWPNGISGGNAAKRTLRLRQTQGTQNFTGVQPELTMLGNGRILAENIIQGGVTGTVERANNYSLPFVWNTSGMSLEAVLNPSDAIFLDANTTSNQVYQGVITPSP